MDRSIRAIERLSAMSRVQSAASGLAAAVASARVHSVVQPAPIMPVQRFEPAQTIPPAGIDAGRYDVNTRAVGNRASSATWTVSNPAIVYQTPPPEPDPADLARELIALNSTYGRPTPPDADPPSDPDPLVRARSDTDLAAAPLLAAQAHLDEVHATRAGQPSGLRHELNTEIQAAERDVSAARAELTETAVLEQLAAVGQADATASQDPYLNTGASLQVRLESIGVSSVNAQLVADASIDQALALPVTTLPAARAQTNRAAWDAIEAENAAVAHARQATPDEPAAAQAWQTEQMELEAGRDTAWNEFSVRAAVEVTVYQDTFIGPVTDPEQHGTDYLAAIQNRGFPDVYQNKIDHFAGDTPPSDAFSASAAETAAPYLNRIEAAYELGGTDALLEEMEAVSEELSQAPFVIGDQTFTPDSAESSRRLLELQETMAPGLRPFQELLAEQTPADLQALAELREYADSYDFEVDPLIAQRLERTVSLLPTDLAPDLVLQTRATWSLGLRESLVPRYAFGIDHTAAQTYQTYARISDIVGDQMGGEPAFTALADETISAFETLPPDAYLTITDGVYQASASGEGYALTVELINRLSANPAMDGAASRLLADLNSGSRRFFENTTGRVEDWSENRAQFDTYIADFRSASDPTGPDGCVNPGQIDTAALDLRTASEQYLANNPAMSETDQALMTEIMLDGKRLFNLEVAVAQLSPQAAQLNGAQSLPAMIDDFLGPENDLAQLYLNSPLVGATLQNQLLDLINSGAIDPAGIDLQHPETWAEALSDTQGFFSMPRNFRFMIVEFAKAREGGTGSLIEPAIGRNISIRWSGIPLLAVAGTTSVVNALGIGDPDASAVDRSLSTLQGSNYYYLAVRDLTEMAGNRALASNATGRAATWLSGASRSLGLKPAKGSTPGNILAFEAADKTTAKVGPRVIFVASDVIGLVRAANGGDNGMTMTGRVLSTGGSVLMVADALGMGSTAIFGGPVAWAGTALWAGGSLLMYQGNRIDGYNRNETADGRLFLSNLGAHDPLTGNLRPITDDTWVSPFEAHTEDFWQAGERPPGGNDIVYRGISANAVDELMNNNDDSNDPITAIHALSELARANELAPRELIMNWYDNLSAEQQKKLPVAAFDVDATDYGAPVSSEFFDVYGSRDSLTQALLHQRDTDENLEHDSFTATLIYLNEHLTDHDAGNLGYGTIDSQAVRGALDLGPLPASQPEPTRAVRAVLDAMYLSEPDGYRRSYEPHNLQELELWLDIHDYPALPDPSACDFSPLPARPEAIVTEAASPDPILPGPVAIDPVDHFYEVVAGDTLWDIAARTEGDEIDVYDLISYHNHHTEAMDENFDPVRADSDFFSAHALADLRRDPDLIRPGDLIYVHDASNIADKAES